MNEQIMQIVLGFWLISLAAILVTVTWIFKDVKRFHQDSRDMERKFWDQRMNAPDDIRIIWDTEIGNNKNHKG